MRFSGEYNVSIDLKGRISIPALFREELRDVYQSESLVVTRNEDGLVAYPPKRWDDICSRVEQMPASDKKDAIWRVRIAPAQECTFNAQGRIQIPQSLRSGAGLEKDVVVIGMRGKIEIWSQQAHEAVIARSESLLADNPQEQADLGF